MSLLFLFFFNFKIVNKNYHKDAGKIMIMIIIIISLRLNATISLLDERCPLFYTRKFKDLSGTWSYYRVGHEKLPTNKHQKGVMTHWTNPKSMAKTLKNLHIQQPRLKVTLPKIPSSFAWSIVGLYKLTGNLSPLFSIYSLLCSFSCSVTLSPFSFRFSKIKIRE